MWMMIYVIFARVFVCVVPGSVPLCVDISVYAFSLNSVFYVQDVILDLVYYLDRTL